MKKRIAIIGSTGSIGTQTCDVINEHRDEYEIVALAAYHNSELLHKQVTSFNPKYVYTEENKENGLSLETLTTLDEVDIVVGASVGHSGLEATIAASKASKIIALANKESLVSAGEIINENCKKSGSRIHPVDSEHSAIWQCLLGESKPKKIILTASGGPFRQMPKFEMENITPEQALKHPSWNMGQKVTIDSSTLMNKGLEVIEAYRLFEIELEQIEVLVHPESIVHSMVEFVDGAIKAQLGVPDMRIPIQFALSYPNRLHHENIPKMDLDKLTVLHFERPDTNKFPCLDLAIKAASLGKTYPAALCAADEIAVEAFLNKKIKYTDIPVLIKSALDHHKANHSLSSETIRKTDIETKEYVKNLIK